MPQDSFVDAARHGSHAAVRMLLERLRAAEVVPRADTQDERSEPERLAEQFGRYLRKERSLANATVLNYCPVARLFITERFATGSIDLAKLSVADLHAFVSRHAGAYSTKRVQLMLTALRSFLRFLYLRGDISFSVG